MVVLAIPKMRALHFLILFVACLPLSLANEDYPLGISLGHMQLSSAYYNSENETIAVTTINSTEEWRDYFWGTINRQRLQGPEYDPGIMAMFTRTMKQIEDASTTALGHPAIIRSIVAPRHFSNQPALWTLLRAAHEAGYIRNDYQANQMTHLHNGARLAYGMEDCESYGLPKECDLWWDGHYVMVVEYNELYLSLGFYTAGWYLFIPLKVVMFFEYGEASLAELQSPDEETKTPFFPLIEAIQNFTADALRMVQEDASGDPVASVRAVILAGEASSKGMEHMKKVLNLALPDLEDKFRLELQPNLLGAFGAARRARDFVLDPGPEDEDQTGSVMPDFDDSHAEL